MKYSFKQVDVFSEKPCYGNPVCVVLDGSRLDTSKMQAFARWTNLSETTFVCASAHTDYSVRIFTPCAELPFAGHPTLGTCWALLDAGILKGNHFKQECAYGIIDLVKEGNTLFFTLPSYKLHEEIPKAKLEKALNKSLESDAMLIHTGPHWIVAKIREVSDLDSIVLNKDYFLSLAAEIATKHEIDRSNTGVTVYGFDGDRNVHVRTFFVSGSEIVEDPVCGSGNASVGVHIKHTGRINSVGAEYQAFQGKHLGRDGRVFVRIGEKIRVGGHCSTVLTGLAEL